MYTFKNVYGYVYKDEYMVSATKMTLQLTVASNEKMLNIEMLSHFLAEVMQTQLKW